MSNKLSIENARIIFRNFEGRESDWNRLGDRNFCVVISEELAEQLTAEGWNVKIRPPRDEQDEPLRYIKVNVKYGSRPPRIRLVTKRNVVLLNAKTVGQLDSAEIKNVDITINPYEYKPGKISAYVDSMYVTIEEDAFAYKYATEEFPEE